MKTTLQFLDAVRARHGLTSDYQLAKFLAVKQATVSGYRHQKSMMDEAMCLKIAAALELEPGDVLIAIAIEREKRVEVKTAWQRVVKRLAGTAAGVLACWLLMPPSPAEAATLHNAISGTNPGTLAAWIGTIYTYATKRLRRLLRSAQALILAVRRALTLPLVIAALAACGGTDSQPPPAQEQPVVFLGDSITAFWPLAGFEANAINAGIAGDSTTQMEARFQSDVIGREPRTVVILGGINDLNGGVAGGVENLRVMAIQAASAGIHPVLCTLLPTTFIGATSGKPLEPDVVVFNQQLQAMAQANALELVDYHAAMILPDGSQNTALFVDQVHPNAAGYAAMESTLQGRLP